MDKKLNILIVNWQCIKNPFGGGAEVHMHEIFSRIVKMGHSVTLFCCKFKNCRDEEVIDGIKIIRRGSRNLFNYVVKKNYKSLIKKNDYDIVIDDINKIPFYMPRYVQKPLLAISHHFFGDSIFREAGITQGLYVNIAEKLVDVFYKKTPFAVVSQSTLDEFMDRGFDKKYFDIVPNAIHQDDFPMKVCKKFDELSVTYFGRLKKYKSVDHLVKAFAKISNKFPNAKLHIIGKGDYRPQLEILCTKLDIFDRVIFHGFVSNEEKVELLKQSQIVVNTSMKEGWGITNIESNACGTPTISANVPGLRDSVKDGESGLLYEYGNIDELARKIDTVLSDEELLGKLSEGAVAWAKEFSWDKSADMMLEVIEKTINRN